jgi:glycerate kinase
VITGEGRTDRQTLMGKLPYQVAQRAKKLGKRCVVISGDGDGTLVGDKVITLTDKDTPPRAAIAHAAALLAEKADLLLQ